jgi:hypothetical protein
MSENIQADTQETDHAMLVVWGQFANCLGIPQAFAEVPMSQKTVIHTPQSKVLEFLVANLAGLPYAKDISQAPQPLDQDQAVAKAWGVDSWADYSGVSRTLHTLTEAQAGQYAAILDQATQLWVDQEVQMALNRGPIELDGDLSPRPVSNGSKTYPGTEYGYMGDGLQLGYQAAIVSTPALHQTQLRCKCAQPNLRTAWVVGNASFRKNCLDYSGRRVSLGGRAPFGAASTAAHRFAGTTHPANGT